MMRSAAVITGSIILFSAAVCPVSAGKPNKEKSGTIAISGAWALYPMAVKWAEEYQKTVPGVRIDISAGGAGKGMADCLSGAVDIGMVSREIYPEEIAKGAWWIAVTKDAVVPTMNAANPVLNDILKLGVTKESLIDVWIRGTVKNWNRITNTAVSADIHVYTRSDACGAASTWAAYLGAKQEDLLDVAVYGDPGLVEAVKNDRLGIGFNNINYVYDNKTEKQIPGICVIPLDLNENGRIDAEEDFYATRDDMVRAIADARYPSPPARELNLVCKGRPEPGIVREFLEWVLTEGQAFVPDTGYIRIAETKIQGSLEKLNSEDTE
ncbi:substrate-binding domain-containing protein [bacterium]|nr:substrate-binding domain-containing protein [bacterium]